MRLSGLAVGLSGLVACKVLLDAHLQSFFFASNNHHIDSLLWLKTSSASKVTEDLQEFRKTNVLPTIETRSESDGDAVCHSTAYAFVIGGCNPDNGRYLGFLYNVLVATQRLRDEGSKADVVVMLQLSPNTTAQRLPIAQEKALRALNINIHYIPKAKYESFYDTVLNKFRVLQLTQYCRVMLLDADVMPLGNLDYLMQLPFLRPNVIVAGALEPANGGTFVIRPGPGLYEELQDIIARRNLYNRTGFDPIWGWGHVIRPPDQWVARRRGERGTNWTFHFAFSDQGLLYHWTKYVQRNVSIVFNDRVENWGRSNSSDEDVVVELQQTIHKPFVHHSHPRLRVYAMCNKLLCDIVHFVGSKKPWLRRPPKDVSNATQYKDATYLWWHTLQKIDQEVGLKLDYDHWRAWQEAPLGGYATMPKVET